MQKNKHDSPTNVSDPASAEKAFDLRKAAAQAGNFVLPIKDWLWENCAREVNTNIGKHRRTSRRKKEVDAAERREFQKTENRKVRFLRSACIWHSGMARRGKKQLRKLREKEFVPERNYSLTMGRSIFRYSLSSICSLQLLVDDVKDDFRGRNSHVSKRGLCERYETLEASTKSDARSCVCHTFGKNRHFMNLLKWNKRENSKNEYLTYSQM